MTKSEVFTLTDLNCIAWEPQNNQMVSFQSRYRQKPTTATVHEVLLHKKMLILKLTEEADGLTSGQSCVLYSGSRCLGGGIIA